MARLEPNLLEEGLLLHVAQRLVAGEHLYRDIVFFAGPLPFELLGLLFRLFGEEIVVARAAAALLHGATAGLAYALARRAGVGAVAHAAAALIAVTPVLLFPSFSMFFYTPLAFDLGLAAAYATLRGTESSRWAGAAGVLVACVALCKQSLGVTLAVGLLATLASCAPPAARRARLAAMILGGAAIAALTLAIYTARGDLIPVWRYLVVVPLSLGDAYTSPFINLWPPGELAPEIQPNKTTYFPSLYFLRHGLFVSLPGTVVLGVQLLYALPLLALAATPLARLTGPLPAAVWTNAALVLAMATNLFPRSDWGHLVYALPAAFMQVLLLVGLLPGVRPPDRFAARAGAALLVAMLGGSAVGIAGWLQNESGPPDWGPRIPLRPVSAVHRIVSIPRIITYLRERVKPGEPIFVARAEPLLYFATDTTNPTPFTGVLTVLHEEQESAILEALGSVRFVVMSDVDQPLWTYYSHELPAVQKHLERHFRIPLYFPLDDASWILVLERGPDRGPTSTDLIDERPRAHAWLRETPEGTPVVDAKPPPRLVARHNRRALPIRLGAWGGGIDYRISVPDGAHFQAGVGYRGMVSLEDLHEHPKRSRIVISVARDGRNFETLHSERVSDAPRAGRRWVPVDVDLSAYAGEEVTLRLELVPEIRVGRSDLTWLGSPRIATPTEPRQRPDGR